MLEGDRVYEGREQSRVKHEVLRRYLESFAHIVGFKWSSITYVDGFSGPWNAQTDDLRDTSFSIALNELRRARDTHALKGRTVRIRCVFVEKDRIAYRRLKEYADSVKDADVRTFCGEFETSIPDIITFIREDPDTFSFVLIDPTGASGFRMKVIAPLLKLLPGEVLINFILEFIRRQIELEGLRGCLTGLFGAENYGENLAELTGIDRDDEITKRYCAHLRSFCKYKYVLRASVFHPDQDRLYYQLIYGTRHPKGVDVFKRAEKQAMHEQEKTRARVEEEQRKAKSGGQKSLLDSDAMPESRFYIDLRNRYISEAMWEISEIINRSPQVPYDELWSSALEYPMVWESDLRNLLKKWRDQGIVRWNGMGPHDRVLKRGTDHVIERIGELPAE